MKYIILFLLFTHLHNFSALSQAKKYDNIPRQYFGEYLSYNMEYLGLNVAILNFHISDKSSNQPKTNYRLNVTARSTKKAGLLFKVDNDYVTIFDADTFLPIKIHKKIRQKNIKHKLTIHFDHENHYARIPDSHQWEISDPCYDYFSMLYFLRTTKFDCEDTLRFYLDSEFLISRIEAIVSPDKETISVPFGDFNALKINLHFQKMKDQERPWKTDLLTNRLAKPGSKLTIWLSDDPRRLPLKLQYHHSLIDTKIVLTDYRIEEAKD